jgi:hypothetical protein
LKKDFAPWRTRENMARKESTPAAMNWSTRLPAVGSRYMGTSVGHDLFETQSSPDGDAPTKIPLCHPRDVRYLTLVFPRLGLVGHGNSLPHFNLAT